MWLIPARVRQYMENSRRILPHILDALLTSNRFTDTFAGTSVRPSTLTSNWEPASVTQTAITLDVSQPSDVLRDLASQLTFDQKLFVLFRVAERHVEVRLPGLWDAVEEGEEVGDIDRAGRNRIAVAAACPDSAGSNRYPDVSHRTDLHLQC